MKFSILKILTLIIIITISYSCSSMRAFRNEIKQITISKLSKGMTEKEFYAVISPGDGVYKEIDIKYITDKKVNVKICFEAVAEMQSLYFIAFVDGKLLYWGYPYKFAVHTDPFINKIGKLAYDIYEGNIDE